MVVTTGIKKKKKKGKKKDKTKNSGNKRRKSKDKTEEPPKKRLKTSHTAELTPLFTEPDPAEKEKNLSNHSPFHRDSRSCSRSQEEHTSGNRRGSKSKSKRKQVSQDEGDFEEYHHHSRITYENWISIKFKNKRKTHCCKYV